MFWKFQLLYKYFFCRENLSLLNKIIYTLGRSCRSAGVQGYVVGSIPLGKMKILKNNQKNMFMNIFTSSLWHSVPRYPYMCEIQRAADLQGTLYVPLVS